jgi:hypothetical protein
MNDDEIMVAQIMAALRGAEDSLTDVRMSATAESITARARNRRLRRGAYGAGAGVLALGVGLGVVVGGSGGVTPVSSDKSVHVNLAAWSVNTTPSGIVDVTVRQLTDPALLRQTLAEAGVPAYVAAGELCTTGSGDLPQQSQVIGDVPVANSANSVIVTVNPAAMPSGSELLVSMTQQVLGQRQALVIAVDLVDDGPVSCTPAPTEPS